MFLRKLSFRGIKGAYNMVDLDFTPKTRKEFVDNVEYFGLKENKNEFGALKQIAMVGLNSSGKTSCIIAASLGIMLLKDPINAYRTTLASHINNFTKDSLYWKYEFVMSGDKNKVYKYEIEIEWSAGRFSKEKITLTKATKTTTGVPEILYELMEQGKIKIGNKTYNHNPSTSLFSLVWSGQTTPEIKRFFSDHDRFFAGVSIAFDYSSEFSNMPVQHVTMDKNNPAGKLFLSMLQNFDPMIKSIETDAFGNIEYVIKAPTGSGLTENKVKFAELPNFLSRGTLTFVSLAPLFISAVYRKNPGIYCFDEIDSSTHIGLFKFLFEVMRKSSSQFIFSSHSPDILKLNLRDDQIVQIKRDDAGIISAERISDKNFNKNEKTINNLSNKFISSPNREKLMKVIKQVSEI